MVPLAHSDSVGSGKGGNCSVPKKEREIRGVNFRVVKGLFHLDLISQF